MRVSWPCCFLLTAVVFLLYNLRAFPALINTTRSPRTLTLYSQSRVSGQLGATAHVRAAIAAVPLQAVAPADDEAQRMATRAPKELIGEHSAQAAPPSDLRSARGGRMLFPSSRPSAKALAKRLEAVRTATSHSFSFRKSCAAGDYRESAVGLDHGMRVPSRPLNRIVQSDAAWPAAGCAPKILCDGLARVALQRQLILVVATTHDLAELTQLVESASSASVADQILVIALDERAAQGAVALPIGAVWQPDSLELGPRSAKYHYAAVVVGTGASVLVVDVGVRFQADPFGNLYGDADLEVPGQGNGNMMVAMDFEMGWSQMCETYYIPRLNPHMWYAAATHESRSLLERIAYRMANLAESVELFGSPAEAGPAEAYILTEELVAPAHEGVTRAGASLRVLDENCLARSACRLPSPERSPAALSQRNILDTRAFKSKRKVLADGCVVTSKVAAATIEAPWVEARGMPKPRPLNWVLPRDMPFPSADACNNGLQALCQTLRQVAVNREVLAAVWKNRPYTMLDLYVSAVKRAKISNSLIVALDTGTAEHLRLRGEAHYERQLEARGGGKDNHATSGLKFKVLIDFALVGCSVLLSDVDVLWLQNPFIGGLYRDSDVEGMSDGWDHPTTYGHHSGDGSFRLYARNSGMFFLQATNESLAMMRRLARRMEVEGTWDQSAFNQEQFKPAFGSHIAVGVTSRAMPYLCNMNSKTWFRFLREDSELLHGYVPLSLHINYHPEKYLRMRDVYAFFSKGEEAGIWTWNGGEGSKLMTECKRIQQNVRPDASKALITRILKGGKIDWGTCLGCLSPLPNGDLTTPWKPGRWGAAGHVSVYPDVDEAIFMTLGGATHLLRFNESGQFLSTRCSDGEQLVGTQTGW